MFSARARSFASFAPIVLVALALRPVADAPRFVPKEGVVVKRTLEMKGGRDLTRLTMRAGDESQDIEGASLHIDSTWKHVVKDELQKCSKAAIQKVARTYELLEKTRTETSKDKSGEDKTTENPETCDLTGKTVVFTWDADKKEFGKKLEGDGEEKLVEDLEADMDYRALLPEPDAEAGAKWEVDLADAKMALFRPGGDLPFQGEKEVRSMDKRLRGAAWDSTKGKVLLELGAATEEDGHKRVAIKFQGDLSTDAETEREGDEKGPAKLHVVDAQKFEGELVWDLDAGRAHSIEWSSKGEMTLTVSLPAKTKAGDDLTVEQIFTFDEEYTYTGTFKVQ